MTTRPNHSRVRMSLLSATALAALATGGACTVNTGVDTTPTFSPARYLPPDPAPAGAAAPGAPAAGPTTEPTVVRRTATVTGVRAIAKANRESTIDPDDTTMRGATWFIEPVNETLIYRVRTAPGRVTTVLLPPGERFNGAVGGDVEAFLINVTYAGPRPAVSILPRYKEARGNLQLVTTGGFYSFELVVNENVAQNLIDLAREPAALPRAAADQLPQPQGDFTRLTTRPVGDAPLPAWSPAEAWADSFKMVVRFDGPLPVLPALLAGMKGEQLITYRSVAQGGQGGHVFLVTNRRVTEAELRLGAERVRITVDPDAIKAGTAADPALGAAGWRPAAPVPPAPARRPVRLIPRDLPDDDDAYLPEADGPETFVPEEEEPTPEGAAAVAPPPPPPAPRPARQLRREAPVPAVDRREGVDVAGLWR